MLTKTVFDNFNLQQFLLIGASINYDTSEAILDRNQKILLKPSQIQGWEFARKFACIQWWRYM